MTTKAAILVLIFLIACGDWGCRHATSGWNDAVNQFPVVRVDAPLPKTDRYILQFPAGYRVTTMVLFNGNLFGDSAQQPLTVTFNRDVYVYKDWVSFDRETWVQADQAFDFTLDIQFPSYEQPRVSRIDMSLNVQ